MCASNSVAILLSLPSVNGKVCYDEISVSDKICCVIVFSFILVFKGIGCYFFSFSMTLMLCPLSAPSSPFTHSLVVYLEGSFSSVTSWGKQVFSRVVSVDSLPYPPVEEHYYLEIYIFSDLSNPTRYLHKSVRNNRVKNSPSFSNASFYWWETEESHDDKMTFPQSSNWVWQSIHWNISCLCWKRHFSTLLNTGDRIISLSSSDFWICQFLFFYRFYYFSLVSAIALISEGDE